MPVFNAASTRLVVEIAQLCQKKKIAWRSTNLVPASTVTVKIAYCVVALPG